MAEQGHVRTLTAEQVVRVLEGIRDINAESSLDGQLVLIAKITTALAGCERCTVFLMDEEKRELWSKVATGLTDQEIRLRLGRGIAGTVAETGVLENIPDAYGDPRFNPDVDRATGFRTRNLLVVPVTNPQRQVVGVLQLINKLEGSFTDTDEALITVFGAQVAIAIQNVQRLEEFRHTDRELKQAFLTHEQRQREQQEVKGKLRFIKVGASVAIVLALAYLGARWGGVSVPLPRALRGQELAAPPGEAPPPAQAPVTATVTVARATLTSKVVQIGALEPVVTKFILSPIASTVTEVFVREGEVVPKGKSLVRLDDRELRARLFTAKANLLRAQQQSAALDAWSQSPEVAQAQRGVTFATMALEEGQSRYDVAQRLFAQGIASREEVETARRAVERLTLEVQTARENFQAVRGRFDVREREIVQSQIANAQAEVNDLERGITNATVVAPFEGLVMLLPDASGGTARPKFIEAGDTVAAGTPLLNLGDISRLRVRIGVDEVDVDKIRVGQRVEAKIEAFPGTVLEGQIDFIAPLGRVVEKVAFFDVMATIAQVPPEVRRKVRLGMSSTIEIVTTNRPDVLAVPVQAIRREGEESIVDVVQRTPDGKATRQPRPVQVGVVTEKLAEIVGGLEEGEEIALP
jgi:multidrug resistance efflux pump/GAF domain-containing protein